MFIVIVLYPIKGLLKIKNANLEVLYTATIFKISHREEKSEVLTSFCGKLRRQKSHVVQMYMPQWKWLRINFEPLHVFNASIAMEESRDIKK